MLFTKKYGSRGPLVVMLHWLGGSAQSWNEVAQYLGKAGLRGVALDLPGFGDSREDRDLSLEEMVHSAMQTIRSLRANEADAPWFLAGHSMGGKIATMIARASEDGEDGLANLRGIVLLSPSPPGPEPMKESKREAALRDLGPETVNPKERRAHASAFVDDNIGKLPLPDAIRLRTIRDVERMNPDALAEWMRNGSKMDCSAYVGRLKLPALILAGTEEQALGADAQRTDTLPHFENPQLVPLVGAGHLAPLERPFEVCDRMVEFFDELGVVREPNGAALSLAFSGLIQSDRTSPHTREVFLARMRGETGEPRILSRDELRTMRALAARIVPDAGFDLIARIHQSLAQSKHDGWRFDTLPDDGDAWKVGVASLDAASSREFDVPFIALDPGRQDHLLKRAQDGELGKGLLGSLHLGESADTFDGAQMRDWFEDVRGEMAKAYVADPRTMERIGFTGFADEDGFINIQLGQHDEVEV